MARSRRKLRVDLSEELVDALRELADQHDSSLTDELKKAIQDRKYFADKLSDGNEVVLEREAGAQKVRTLVDLR